MAKHKKKLLFTLSTLIFSSCIIISSSNLNVYTPENKKETSQSESKLNQNDFLIDITNAKQVTVLGKKNVVNVNERRIKIDNKTSFLLNDNIQVDKAYHLEKAPAGSREQFMNFYFKNTTNYNKSYIDSTGNTETTKPVVVDPKTTKYASVYDLSSFLKNSGTGEKYFYNPFDDLSGQKLVKDIKSGMFKDSGTTPVYRNIKTNKYLTHTRFKNNQNLKTRLANYYRNKIWSNDQYIPENLLLNSLNDNVFQVKFFLTDDDDYDYPIGKVIKKDKNNDWKILNLNSYANLSSEYQRSYLERQSSYNWIIENTYNPYNKRNYLVDLIKNLNHENSYNNDIIKEQVNEYDETFTKWNITINMPKIYSNKTLFNMNSAHFEYYWSKKQNHKDKYGNKLNGPAFFFNNNYGKKSINFNFFFNINKRNYMKKMYSGLPRTTIHSINNIYRNVFANFEAYSSKPDLVRNIRFNSDHIYTSAYNKDDDFDKRFETDLGVISEHNSGAISNKLNNYIESGIKRELNDFYKEIPSIIEKEVGKLYKPLGDIVFLNKQPLFIKHIDGGIEPWNKKIKNSDWKSISNIINTTVDENSIGSSFEFDMKEVDSISASINTQNTTINHSSIGKPIEWTLALATKNIYKNSRMLKKYKKNKISIYGNNNNTINLTVAIFDSLYSPIEYYTGKALWNANLLNPNYKTIFTYNRPWITDAKFWDYINNASYDSIKMNEYFAEGYLKPIYSNKLLVKTYNSNYYIENNIFYPWELKLKNGEYLYFETYEFLVSYVKKYNEIRKNINTN